MTKEPAEYDVAFHLVRHHGACGILVAERNGVGEAAMRAMPVVMGLDALEDVVEMVLAEQNEIVERLPRP